MCWSEQPELLDDKKAVGTRAFDLAQDRQQAIVRSKFMIGKLLVWLLATALLTSVSVNAQQSKIPRIGYVASGTDPKNPGPNIEAFRQGLRDLGYVEGKNIVVEYRYRAFDAKQDAMPGIVAELIQLKVDILVSSISTVISAARQASKTLPIVMIISGDPVASGFIDSLAHPGGNITGVTRLARELSGKRLESLKEAVPGISRVGILWHVNAPPPGLATALEEYQAAGRALKIPIQSLEIRHPNPDFEGVFQAASRKQVNGFIAVTNSLITTNQKSIVAAATKHRMASMFEDNDKVASGGLMAYSADNAESYRRAAVFVDKILKGTKPADLPVEQPTKFEFVVNLKTAKQIGVTIPPEVLARANRIIR